MSYSPGSLLSTGPCQDVDASLQIGRAGGDVLAPFCSCLARWLRTILFRRERWRRGPLVLRTGPRASWTLPCLRRRRVRRPRVGRLVQQPPPALGSRLPPASGVRSRVLSHATDPSHRGWTHVTESPGNSGRFSLDFQRVPCEGADRPREDEGGLRARDRRGGAFRRSTTMGDHTGTDRERGEADLRKRGQRPMRPIEPA
jgi:hypothetical protein